MKTIRIIIEISIVSFLASCSYDEVVYEDARPEIYSTGDKADDIGTPNDEKSVVIVKDSIVNTINATGDKADDIGNPND